MNEQKTRGDRTRERREQRAERILDATMELVLRLGYSKTTLDDIARHSDVGKGTLFLHWPNRDALFVSLLRRERLKLLTEVRESVTHDPGQLTLYGFTRLLVTARHNRPLLTALLLGDQETLGRLAERKRGTGDTTDLRREFAPYLEELRVRGLVREDLSSAEQWFAFAAISYGYAALPATAAEDLTPPGERVAELCAETVSRTLAPHVAPTPARQAEFNQVTLDYLDRMLTLSTARYLASRDGHGHGHGHAEDG